MSHKANDIWNEAQEELRQEKYLEVVCSCGKVRRYTMPKLKKVWCYECKTWINVEGERL